MIFWRAKTNQSQQDEQTRQENLIHKPGEPALEPSIDISDANGIAETLPSETETDILEDMNEIVTPVQVPFFNVEQENDDPDQDSFSDDTGGGWLSRLTQGLTKSSMKLTQGLSDFVSKKKLDAATLSRLEDLLIEADVGPVTAKKIITFLSQSLVDRDVDETDIRHALADQIEKILAPCVRPLMIKKPSKGPFYIVMCGVNGAGKTTTIGKMAKIMHDQKHHRVMMVAGDTFRAAATEQLQVWGGRAHAPVMSKDIGADAAALAYESYEMAMTQGVEVVLMDTAGRLHNKSSLMAELQKVIRVLKKHGDDVPHETILVLDGTTGQNAFAQVRTFQEMVSITGLIVTKLDGSAKGGVVIGLADQFGLPIYAVGVGEGAEDLQPFTAGAFARSLVGLSE